MEAIMDETHIIIGAAWCLIGYTAGMLAMVCWCWRRLTRPSEEDRRRLESALDDAQAQITRKQAIVDELTAQASQLYTANARLARRYVELAAGRTRGMVT
jgi:hypothetical protein